MTACDRGGDLSVSGQMARPRVNFESMLARFPAGTLAQIDAVRWPHETRTEFVQRAVDHLIRARGGTPASSAHVGDDTPPAGRGRQGDAER